MNKNKRRKLIIMCLVGLIIMIGGYITYKIYNVNYYNIAFKTSDVSFDIKEEKVINKKDYNGNYIIHNNINIPNYFDDYEATKDENSVIYTNKNNENRKFVLMKTNIATPVKYLESITLNDNHVGKKILEKNNINSDIELIKYLKDYETSKRTIFTNLNKMLEDEAIYNFMVYYHFDNVTIFTGNITGYMTEINDSCKNVSIFNNDIVSTITFCDNSYFTNEYIYDLLSKIKKD